MICNEFSSQSGQLYIKKVLTNHYHQLVHPHSYRQHFFSVNRSAEYYNLSDSDKLSYNGMKQRETKRIR